MAELFSTTFPGSSLPGTMSTDHRLGGSHAVSGGNLTLTTAATAESYAIARQTTAVAMADGDTATVRYVSDTAGGTAVIALRTGTGDGLFLPNVSVNGSGQWYTRAFRISTGPGATRVTGASASTRPWVRFRRSGTSVVIETATDSAGLPGAWTTLDTWLDTDGLWVSSFAAVQVEVAAYTPTAAAQSLVISRIGVSSLLSTDLQLRFSAAGLTVDSAVMPVAAGGGGGATNILFQTTWSNALGNTEEAINDGTLVTRKWNNSGYCGRGDIMEVVSAATASSPRPGNVFRTYFRSGDGSGCGQLERLEMVGLGQSHYGRFFFNRRDRTYNGSIHNWAYQFVGNIQFVYFNPNAFSAAGWRVQVGLPGTFPFQDWGIQSSAGSDPLNPPWVLYDYDTWYLYEWHVEYLSGGTRFRFYPRLSTAAGTLLADASNFYQMATPSQGTATLQSWYNAGNDFPVVNATLHRNIGLGNEGRVGSPTTGTFYDVADYAIAADTWIGTAVLP